jgi:hypothetical protein
MSNLTIVRKAVAEVWGSFISSDKAEVQRIIKAATYTGKNDPGQWAPSAAVVIHTESGIPNGGYNPRDIERWFEVSDMLPNLSVEHVNGAVIAVYKDY